MDAKGYGRLQATKIAELDQMWKLLVDRFLEIDDERLENLIFVVRTADAGLIRSLPDETISFIALLADLAISHSVTLMNPNYLANLEKMERTEGCDDGEELQG